MGEGVHSITPHNLQLDAPAELRGLPAWIMWRLERYPGEDKPRKVPYWTNGQKRHGHQGSPEDRARLVTFDAAKAAAARSGYDGVGFCPLPDWGITALDFDRCIDEMGRIPAEIVDIVSNTYAEYSPSGTGIRAFVKGQLGNHKSRNGAGADWGVETFASSGFVTFTGHPLMSTEALALHDTIAPAGPKIISLCERRFGALRERQSSTDPLDLLEPPLGLSIGDMEGLLSDLDPSMGRDDWIRVGMALHHETSGDDTGFTLWDEWSSGGVQYPGTENLQGQWDSFERSEVGKRPVTMASVRKMSAEARQAQGLEPRISEALQRAAEEAKQAPKDDSDRVGTPEDFTGKFAVIPASEFAQRPSPAWIVKGLLPDADVGVIYGASGSGKSFIVVDVMMHVAQGIEWRGRRVKPGRVLYIVAEGGGGVPDRLKAYVQHHKIDLGKVPLGIIHAVPNLLNEDDIAELLSSVSKAGGVDLIVIDTFAQVTPGANENSGEDMGKALRHARMLREVTGAMVLLVHHSGKDQTRGARGWSGIKAAADVELEVIRPEDSETRLLRTSKQKDGRDDLRWGFDLEEIILGFDADGDEITSVVAVEAEVPEWRDETEVQMTSNLKTAIVDALKGAEIGGRGPYLTTAELESALAAREVSGDMWAKLREMAREGVIQLEFDKVLLRT